MQTPQIADRVAETTSTTGTGTVNLAGALSRYRGFVAAVGTGSLVEYTIVHRSANEWEVGVGTVTAGSPDTLTRSQIKASSSGGTLVNFSAGTKDVFIAHPATRLRGAGDAYFAATL